MKSTLIVVCGLIAFTAAHPAFANDKRVTSPRGGECWPQPLKAPKDSKPTGFVVHVGKHRRPWVGRTVTISESERHVIREYVHNRMNASKGGKFNGVSQGLTTKVTWGWGKLPDGWEQQCVRGKVLSAEVHNHCHSLPDDIIFHLPPPPPGTVLLAVGGKVIRVGYPTYEILDTFDVRSPPAQLMGQRPARPALQRLAAATPK